MNIDVNNGESLYEILGVEPTATLAQIKSAYRHQARAHHPDSGGDERLFKRINEAHTILENRTTRAQYDQALAVIQELEDDNDPAIDALLADLDDSPDWATSVVSATDPMWFRASETLPGDLRDWATPSAGPRGNSLMTPWLIGAVAVLAVVMAAGYVLLG